MVFSAIATAGQRLAKARASHRHDAGRVDSWTMARSGGMKGKGCRGGGSAASVVRAVDVEDH